MGIPMKIIAQAYEDKEAQGNLRPSPGPGHVNRPGYTGGPGYVAGLMGLSVTRLTFRSITKDSRWRNIQDLLIKERLDTVVI